MLILARFTNFCDFPDFRKPVVTAFLRISKNLTVNFEITLFLFICSKNFCFLTQIYLCPEKLNSGSKLRDFSSMLAVLLV